MTPRAPISAVRKSLSYSPRFAITASTPFSAGGTMTTSRTIDPADRAPAPPIEFEPAKLRRRYDGWRAEKQIRFIEALAATKCVDQACRIVGMSDTSAYMLRNRPC